MNLEREREEGREREEREERERERERGEREREERGERVREGGEVVRKVTAVWAIVFGQEVCVCIFNALLTD